MANAGLEVREAGRALRVQTEAPHLVSMGSGRLSTAVTLHPLPEGNRITLGSGRDVDIPVAGTGVEPLHCVIENNNGVVTLQPINGSTAIDGVPINSPLRLAQGCMLSIGRSNYMRFNHPAEAKQLRSVLPHSRISMAPISFTLPDGQSHQDHLEKKPPVAPRKSPRNSYSDDDVGFLGKLTKFEMLAKQNRSNYVSPKVFPAGAVTTNVPANQILGHSRSPSLVSLKSTGTPSNNSVPSQSSGNLERSRSNTPSLNASVPSHVLNSSPSGNYLNSSAHQHITSQGNCLEDSHIRPGLRTLGRSNTPNFLGHNTAASIPSNDHNQIQIYPTAETYLKTYKPYYRESHDKQTQGQDQVQHHDPYMRMLSKSNNPDQNDPMSRSLTYPRSTDLDDLAPSRDFNMSQSLIVTKTTTTEYLQLDKFGSDSSIYNESNNHWTRSLKSNSGSQTYDSNTSVKRIHPPSPAFNRNPRYSSEQKRTPTSTPYDCVKSPTPSIASSCSLEELRERQADAENKRKEAESKRKIAQEERLKEQEVERQEKMRLEEILAMCAEYERQSTIEKQPRQPNRIKTNGSLPRDKRLAYNSPFDSPKSPSKNQPHFSFDSPKQSICRSASYENVSVQNSKLVFPPITNAKNPLLSTQSDGAQTLSNQNCSMVATNVMNNGSNSSSKNGHSLQNHHNANKTNSHSNNTNKNNNNNTNGKNSNSYSNNSHGNSNSSSSVSSISNNNSNNNQTKWPSSNVGNEEHTFSGFIYQTHNPNYENISYEQSALNNNCHVSVKQNALRESQRTYGTIQLNGTRIGNCTDSSQSYENVAALNGNISLYENVSATEPLRNNDPNSHSTSRRNGQLSNSCDIIENKLAISNDDLLEAIEQLSMLSKSKDTHCTTPKRNNNEIDNAKSNEAKADKERKELEEEDRRKYIEFLENEKIHILGNMDALKRSVADIEIQEEEINRELELEKALISAEYESESLKLTQDEGEKIKVQMQINELEREMAEDNTTQANLQAEAKQRVQRAQQICNRLEEELASIVDETDLQNIAEKLSVSQDALETERKAFEDLEFHHLEEEASKLATREELQRYLSELTARIESRKVQLNHFETQRSDAKNIATKDARSLERQKLGHLKRLEEARNRLRAINDELGNLAQNVCENSEEKRSPSREDFDRISRVTTDSPIVNNQGSLGRKTIESLKEIERNRQLHLAKQGSQVISEERRRVEELKRRVQDEVRSQWEERKMNCTSFNSIESGEESSSYSTGPTESGSGSSDGAEGGNNEKLSPSKLSELTSPSPGPSTNSYSLLQNDNMRDNRRTSMEGERLSNNSGGVVDGNGSRPLSQTSSEMDTISPLHTIKHREKTKLQRPLTRYLPIKSESLDLRHHIETAGHQLPLISDVIVDITSCSGYLSKMSKKFHHWNKRWFVFDRKKKTLSYYSDSTSRKSRGVIYFQSIEEVYVDHMNTVKSPQPSLTFIIKTSSRLYHLMAPSPESMRVWVDVVFTGAEGYHEFDHGL